jgi:hypothetical protein
MTQICLQNILKFYNVKKMAIESLPKRGIVATSLLQMVSLNHRTDSLLEQESPTVVFSECCQMRQILPLLSLWRGRGACYLVRILFYAFSNKLLRQLGSGALISGTAVH